MTRSLLLFCYLVFSIQTFAQRADVKLRKQLEQVTAGHHGEVAIYVKDLKTGRVVTINADSIYPTASMVKVPILTGIMDKINRGELLMNQEMVYHDSLLYPGVDILGSFKPGEKI